MTPQPAGQGINFGIVTDVRIPEKAGGKSEKTGLRTLEAAVPPSFVRLIDSEVLAIDTF